MEFYIFLVITLAGSLISAIFGFGSVIINYLGLFLPLPRTTSVALIISAFYGYLSGLFSSGNPIKALALDRMGFEKQSFVGVMAATALGVNLIKLISYTNNNILRPEHYSTGVILVLIAIVSAFAGRRIVQKVNDQRYKRYLSIVLIFSAIILLFK